MNDPVIEEHDLPGIEAALAATMLLMTGYSQSLQADVEPGLRLRMGASIERHLTLLIHHPMLSSGFRQVLHGLGTRWTAIDRCTREAGSVVGGTALGEESLQSARGPLH